jgi:drug/metabolite transporter (DMT)-like permease
VLGVLGMALYFAFENYGLVYTTATNAAILVALIPALTALGAALFFRERLTAANVLGLVVALAASALIIWNGKVRFHLNPLGDVLILFSVVVWSAYTLVGRDVMARYPAVVVSRESLLVAAVCMAPVFAIEVWQGKLGHVTMPAAFGVLYLGLLCTALAYTIWSHCVRVLGAVYTSNLLYFQSAITMVCAWATIREPVTLFLVACTAGLIAGVYFSNRAAGKDLTANGKD